MGSIAIKDDEQLVAYLDDELTPQERQTLEQRLASDGDLRARLADLKQSWELLDDLPETKVTRDFTRSTVEMAAISLETEVQSDLTRWRGIQFLGIFLLALFAGFVAWQGYLRYQEKSILRRLDLIVELELLKEIDSAEWVAELAKIEHLQDAAKLPADSDMLDVPKSIEARAKWLQTLSPLALDSIRESERQFATMPDRRREELQRLHNNIFEIKEDIPDARKLMQSYVAIYKSLPSSQLSAIVEGPLNERRDNLQRIVDRRWLDDYAKNLDVEVLKAVEDWAVSLDSMSDTYSRNFHRIRSNAEWKYFLLWPLLKDFLDFRETKSLSMVTDKDIQNLLELLPDEPLRAFERLDPDSRIEQVGKLTNALFVYGTGRSTDPKRSNLTDAEFAEAFAKLTIEAQERIELSVPNNVQTQLTKEMPRRGGSRSPSTNNPPRRPD